MNTESESHPIVLITLCEIFKNIQVHEYKHFCCLVFCLWLRSHKI